MPLVLLAVGMPPAAATPIRPTSAGTSTLSSLDSLGTGTVRSSLYTFGELMNSSYVSVASSM